MSDIYSVIYSPKALDDLREIYRYIAYTLAVPDIAKNQVDRIRKQIRSLGLMPSRYPIVDWEPWESMGMHKVPVDHFMVYYTVDDVDSKANIVRIVYSGRDIESLIRVV